jgi:hypothetical protein
MPLIARFFQRSSFEGGFKKFVNRFHGEVRDLIERLQQNLKKSHDYLCETLQSEARKRLQGESKVLRESQQSITAVQGTVYDLSRQLKAQLLYVVDFARQSYLFS